VKLRRNTFYQLTILSPTYSPKQLLGSPDPRKLGLAVASLSLRGRPYKNQTEDRSVANFAGAPATSNASAYQFPILA